MSGLHGAAKYQRCYARIDLSAIRHNFDALAGALPKETKKLAILKADAYGHGALAVAQVLQDRADFFGVACVEEALALREGGIRTPILVLSYTSPLAYDVLVREEIRATVFSEKEAEELSRVAEQIGKKAYVHIALDTGMGRIGFLPEEDAADAVERISRLPGIFLEGLFSHYATADEEDLASAREQTVLFDRFLGYLEERGVKVPLRHICNSAGSLRLPDKYDMCRLGIALYGLSPSKDVDTRALSLRPAMEVISHVVHVKEVPAGTKIGYGHFYTAPSRRKIATVAIGYADGFNRCLTGKGYVLIRGKKAPLAGKVCMDLVMVDVTEIEGVSVGDEAVILGRSGEEVITAEALGEMANSFHYEVVCTFLPRVRRVYDKPHEA